MKIKTVVWSGVVAGVLAFPALVEAGAKDVSPVAMKDVPAVVQKTISSNLKGGAVTELDKETDGTVVSYNVNVKGTEGMISKLNIAADGSIMTGKGKGEEEDDDDDDKGGKKDD